MTATFLLLSLLCADWLNVGGDAAHSGLQPREKYLKVDNVKDIRLLWQAPVGRLVSAPVMIGPFITHRGIKELTFVASAPNTVIAIDSDLGRVFWTRKIDLGVAANTCNSGVPAAPAMEPDPHPPTPEAEEDMDYHTKQRPFYFLAGDGLVHTLLPATGEDVRPPMRFFPSGVNAGPLTYVDGKLTTVVNGDCAGVEPAEWSLDVKSGAVMHKPAAANAISTATAGEWRYTPEAGVLRAYRGGREMWHSAKMETPLQPVVVKGIVFALDAGTHLTHAVLHAFHAETGAELYTSGDQVKGAVAFSALGVANGHITFADSAGKLYCFGLPIEIF